MQKHHMIPISIQGYDWKENVMHVSQEEHKLIHNTLNIPYQYIRKFRKNTNHKTFVDRDYANEIRIVQAAYFRNAEKLPQKLLRMHANSMRGLCARMLRFHGVKLHLQDLKGNSDIFRLRYYLAIYHEALRQRAQFLEERIDSS